MAHQHIRVLTSNWTSARKNGPLVILVGIVISSNNKWSK